MAPSFVPGAGRGVFAGQAYENDEQVDVTLSLTILRKNGRKWPLHNYVYSANDEAYSMILFGPAMLFNHRLPKDVDHYWTDWPVASIAEQKLEAHTVYTPVLHKANRKIEIGEEIFTSYGDNDWFHLRGIAHDAVETDLSTNQTYTLDTLQEIGHCLTDIYIDQSTLPLAGNGIFASRSFKKDDIVSISPVLVLPRHAVAADEGVLLNYVIGSPASDVALAPIGLAALSNHGGSDANMRVSWYVWDQDQDQAQDQNTFAQRLKLSPEILVKKEVAQLDIAYRASRDIAAGEELTIFYGEAWEREWVAHLDRLEDWLQDEDEDEEKPQFRMPIEAPSGLFPKWWRGACIGDDCQMINRQAEIERDPMLKKKQEEAREAAQEAIQRARELAKRTYFPPGTGTCANKQPDAIESKGLLGRLFSFWTDTKERVT
eukprot:CAMPEP_0182425022 /NCGR_PEP_ID=MMETSP1167-20130531/11355_1 /TAXON_ID=2988 /ORGANISM="Mallomonas Sp, Strain CCMP3275" /LENGTH=429 /DNA_ID=CAMNT_0024605323 /DNA_START=223 /DNA_END=1512 /DNA_ORIENTATION=-